MKLTDDFLSIVLEETPLLDVRAPVEFEKGAFLNATNEAILTDKERHLVGTRYKKEGNSAAVALAEELIKQEGKTNRVKAWQEYISLNPNAKLYCFRGGQRSGIAQDWLDEAGTKITRLKGGYKAFRTFLMEESLRVSKESKTLILGGYTGSGKTLLLQEIPSMVDLEAIAHHRGSSFGNFASSQPSQIDFENNLAYKLIQHHHKDYNCLVVEHESHNIGRSFMPKELYANLMDGELVILTTPISERVAITHHEYVILALEKYTQMYKDDALSAWAKDTNKNLDKIQKRLGHEKYSELKDSFEDAFSHHLSTNSTEKYKLFIEKLLVNYYDPMYKHQLEKTEIPITFEGNFQEVKAFLKRKG